MNFNAELIIKAFKSYLYMQNFKSQLNILIYDDI